MRFAWVLALALAACSTVDVKSDWDPAANFGALHTWKWQSATPVPTGNVRLDDPLVHKRIQAAIRTALDGRGYRQVVEGKADFEVAYHVAIDRKLDAHTIYTGYGPYRGGGMGGTQTVVDSYDVGTLMIDVIDPATNSVTWRGTAQTRLQDLQTPEEREKRVQEVVDGVLERFPPER
jgi:uncharacterized protein DUF4136